LCFAQPLGLVGYLVLVFFFFVVYDWLVIFFLSEVKAELTKCGRAEEYTRAFARKGK